MFVLVIVIDLFELLFVKDVLLLIDSEYGFLVSIVGVGFILGVIINIILLKKLVFLFLIGIGLLFIVIGYLIYVFLNVFLIVVIGFFILFFFMVYVNIGFYIFY